MSFANAVAAQLLSLPNKDKSVASSVALICILLYTLVLSTVLYCDISLASKKCSESVAPPSRPLRSYLEYVGRNGTDLIFCNISATTETTYPLDAVPAGFRRSTTNSKFVVLCERAYEGFWISVCSNWSHSGNAANVCSNSLGFRELQLLYRSLIDCPSKCAVLRSLDRAQKCRLMANVAVDGSSDIEVFCSRTTRRIISMEFPSLQLILNRRETFKLQQLILYYAM